MYSIYAYLIVALDTVYMHVVLLFLKKPSPTPFTAVHKSTTTVIAT